MGAVTNPSPSRWKGWIQRSSSKRLITSSARASTAAWASAPSARMVIWLPGPAASIISPMIERASTVAPSLATVTSASKVAASLTNLAEARACRPRSLVISTEVSAVIEALFLAGEHVGGDRDVFAAGLLCVSDAGGQVLAATHAGELDQH